MAVPSKSPLPFRQFILKVHSRCNLACDYCYVYEMADQRWRGRPRVFSPELALLVPRRIAEHVEAHGLRQVEVVLHGGEPLLAGVTVIRDLVRRLRTEVPAVVDVAVQTNGTLLDRPFLELFAELGVRVGVSMDGTPEAHDQHRKHVDGTGSWRSVRAALELLSDEFRSVYSGLLCVVDLANDPVETYESLLRFTPPTVDFLLPHGNWSAPPPGRGPGDQRTPYADWLIAVFDRWYGADTRETGVRLLDEILNLLLGGRSAVEGVGLTPSRQVVVETDGSIGWSDILASASPDAASTGLHLGRYSFDAALALPEVAAGQSGLSGLSATCRSCSLVTACGGGMQAHRFLEGAGFDRPSVYCADLFRLITHMRSRLAADLVALT